MELQDYHISSYVAEFINTLTNLAYGMLTCSVWERNTHPRSHISDIWILSFRLKTECVAAVYNVVYRWPKLWPLPCITEISSAARRVVDTPGSQNTR